LSRRAVSVLFNEPKLLKSTSPRRRPRAFARFSALQRAEIAEMRQLCCVGAQHQRFSALQRAEIAEMR